MNDIKVVILAGGIGERFAPLSTPDLPKQFLPITHPSLSMLQQTVSRMKRLVSLDRIYVSTHDKFSPLVRKQIPDLPRENIFVEKFRKNTAPPIACISAYFDRQNPETVVVFVPADHYIDDEDKALSAFGKAIDEAQSRDALITFGVKPTFASTHYGYIEVDAVPSEKNIFKALKFVEKPDQKNAGEFFRSPSYFWNSGMFVWRARILLDAVGMHLPVLAEKLGSLDYSSHAVFEESTHQFYQSVPALSIDYGIMEKAANVVLVSFDAGWSDVGTWNGLKNLAQKFNVELAGGVREILQKMVGSF